MRTVPFMDSQTLSSAALQVAAELKRSLAWLALLLIWSTGSAVESTGLFHVEIPVARKDSDAESEAFRKGLEKVLGRVLRPEDLGSAAVRALLSKPDGVILEYVYQGTLKDGQPVLQVDYDEAQLRKSLRAKGIGLFGPNRPEVLAWIAVEDEQPPRVLSADIMPDWDRALRELAARRALPLTLPMADLLGQQAVTPADIATGNADRIKAASLRYEPEAILTGRVAKKPDGYEADWRLYQGIKEQRWQGKAAALGEALDSGISGAYSRIAAQFIARGTGTSKLELQVSGVTSLEDVNGVTAYISKLSPVAKADMQSVGDDQAVFRLNVRGGRESLEQALAMGGRLRPERADSGSPALSYRLTR